MKLKLLPILTVSLLFCFTRQKAQVSAYSFTQSAGSYGLPSAGTLVGMPLQDDDVNTVTLPFPFVYNGASYSSINICANGYMSFNSISGTEYQPISDPTTTNIIAPFGTNLLMAILKTGDLTNGSNTITNCSSVAGYSVGDILLDYASDFASSPVVITAINGNNIVVSVNAISTSIAYDIANVNGYIKYEINGITPNRSFEVEFANFSRLIYDEVLKFKVRLFETSNKIEFVYGTMIPGQDQTPSEVGLKGNGSDFNSREVTSTGAWNNSSASNSISDVCAFEPGVAPVNGQSYMWAPASCTVPVLTVASNNTVICPGQQAILTATGATTYSWMNGPATQQYTVMPNVTTQYTLVGANTTCTASLTFTQVVVPAPTVMVVPTKSISCVGEMVILSSTGASSYSLNGVAGGPNFTISPAVNTNYTVTGSNGACEATYTLQQKVSTCTGLANISASFEELGLTSYPNPFNNNLSLKNTSEKELSVSICDALGKTVYAAKIKADSVQTLSSESFKSGLYLITVKGETGSFTKKLIKE